MFVIVGLGNPGKKYENTRHNAGFLAIDALASKYGISITEKKHKALCGSGYMEGVKVVLVKPQTYMNLSGESVREVLDFYKLDPEEDMIVMYDDISLAPGNIRIRKKGSAGGHNGIKNIIQHLGNQEFNRIRVGIGKDARIPTVDYVLGKIRKENFQWEGGSMKKVLGILGLCCVCILLGLSIKWSIAENISLVSAASNVSICRYML